MLKALKENLGERLLFSFLFLFSFWLMFHTFSYNSSEHIMLIANKVWSDFAANIPLIRSFSFGHNWPPEYPIYPGTPIQYHFLFYALVGFLEKIGMSIAWALNLPSAIGFFLVLALLYKIPKEVFKDKRVGILTLLFFVFNGSLSFLQYFQKEGFVEGLKKIFSIHDYTGMAPWDGGHVLGVWHLNVYLNQRHFCFALGILMLFIGKSLHIETTKNRGHFFWILFFGTFLGILPLLHKPILLMMGAVMLCNFIFFKPTRVFNLLVGAVAIPYLILIQILGLNFGIANKSSIEWFPGFYMHGNLTFSEFTQFWTWNWGFHFGLILLGFILLSSRQKKVLAPAILVFVVGFLFKFSSDVLANHKFFNFSLMLFNMISAFVVLKLYDAVKIKTVRVALPVLLIPLILSGVLDFIAVANDWTAAVKDIQADPVADWFYKNTSKDTVILNSSFLYHPASIAGRKVFLGWPYFITTAGYDFEGRKQIMSTVYQSQDPKTFCPLLKQNNIEAITVQDTKSDSNLIPMDPEYFAKNFKSAFVSPDGSVSIYKTTDLCL